MNTKKLAGAAFVAATAATALLLGSTAAVAQEPGPENWAFGIAAAGALTIDPLPWVKAPAGEQAQDQLLGIGDVLGRHEDDLALGVLTAEVRDNLSETSVTELNLLELLRADVVRTYCEDGEGGLQIIRGSILGQQLPEDPVPGQVLDLSPLLRLTLNDQTRHEDGSLTVTGIELSVLPAAEQNMDETVSTEERQLLGNLLNVDLLDGGADTVREVVDEVTGALGADLNLSKSLQTVTIGAATCQAGGDGDDNDNGNGDDNADDAGDDNGSEDVAAGAVPAAPRPQVVEAVLAVTG
ncbi:choice-of-anchor P family protein [Pseudonocardia nigra]|uniref:choice-of-anchor P family protein n=1 Tax=Pseudonocardia nigra TaxID=1921578 RepID=UPI001C5EB6D7|nr:choice-of-anchor P family protein [Pseudonocardia nigra]